MLRILIVEDNAHLAATMINLIEENALYSVVGHAEDTESAILAIEQLEPDIVLLDLQLARGSDGFTVAVKSVEMNTPCVFVSGKAPDFPMPKLAIGCLAKPFTPDDLHRTLSIAEDRLRGRDTICSKLPPNLSLYGFEHGKRDLEPGCIPSRLSLRTRLEMLIAKWAAG